MLIPQILISLILIICGLLVKAYPNLIAGYNTLSKKEKERIDEKKLSQFLMKVLLAIGVFSLINYLLLDAQEIAYHYIFLINTSIIVLAVIVASIYSSSKFKR